MKTYSHTQRAGRWLGIPVAMALMLGLIAAGTGVWAALAGIPVLIAAAWLFASLSVEVGGGCLRWRFGPGLIQRAIPLSGIAEASAVRTAWFEGWGIHYSRFGWLYNVAGFDAVALKLTDGRRMAVGTDEPARLLAALRGAEGSRA